MKYTLTLFFILFQLISFSQVADSLKEASHKTGEKVSFIITLDIANATKDGIYLNGYVVNISYEQAEKLNGKKIQVKGKVTIVKGLDDQPKEFGKNGQEIIKQGRSEDARHILSPKIKILE